MFHISPVKHRSLQQLLALPGGMYETKKRIWNIANIDVYRVR